MLVTLADVTPERVNFLWPGRIPAGKLTLLDGDPSAGKSTLALDMAARVSTGRDWPDGVPGTDPADVLILSAEDGLADTIAPRLIAAGADRARIHALLKVPVEYDDGPREMPPSLPRDLPHVERIIAHYGVRLLIVDVLMAYLAGTVDSHRDQDVRGVLHQLADLADRTGCAVVLIRHLNKTAGSNALYRGGGSIGIIGAARAAHIVGRDPDDPDRRILACSKMNLSEEPPALAYRLRNDPRHECAVVAWETGTTTYTATQLLSVVDGAERSERDEAASWLIGYLEDNAGCAAARDVLKAARSDGIAEKTLRRAQHQLGVKAEKSRGLHGGWVWVLPGTAAQDAQPPTHMESWPSSEIPGPSYGASWPSSDGDGAPDNVVQMTFDDGEDSPR